MQVILIEPGKEPALMEVNPNDRVSEVIGGEPVIQALPNLRMGLFTNGEADRQGLADTGALNLGAVSIRVKGKAIVLRIPVEDEVDAENEYGLTIPDVRPCDLALIRACWVPAVERLEERSRRGSPGSCMQRPASRCWALGRNGWEGCGKKRGTTTGR